MASDSASYAFRPDDSYIRVVAKNKNSNIYLNPLVRYSGNNLLHVADIKADENFLLTWINRIFMYALILILLYGWKNLLFYSPFSKKPS